MVKNNRLNFKYGFSLVEALIVMSIFAIFISVIASVIPHKAKPKVNAEAHGGFECYYKANKLYSRNIVVGIENSEKEETSHDANGKYCLFRPDPYLNYIIFNAVGGGSLGGANNGGGAGQYASAFFPTPKSEYKLYPGKGGSVSHADGYPSIVKSGNDTILQVSGGNDATTAENSNISDIVTVYQAGKMPSDVVAYGCNYTPHAWLDQTDGLIHVSYCATSTDIKEKTFIYSNNSLAAYPKSKVRYKTILQSPANTSTSKPLSRLKPNTINVWEYYDVGEWIDYGNDPLTDNSCSYDEIVSMNNPMCPSRFKIEILLNIPDFGDEGAVSSLTKYATLMQYNNLKAVNPGNGGAKNNGAGKDGAILVSW